MSETEGSSKHDECGVTMLDVLQDQEELEEDANAVLGAADENNCTYNDGYVKRQALYSCITCSVPSSPDFLPAGICLACSYHCHEGHELVELYTKRDFKCDCGTKRSCCDCKLQPGKLDNEENRYNQNFSGVYCGCARPYPDPEDATPDQMIQCIVCEDWYHGRHLELKKGPPEDKSYGEMICVHCVRKHPFLAAYAPNKETKSSEGECRLKSVGKHTPKKSAEKNAPEKSAEKDTPKKSAEEIAPEKSAVKLVGENAPEKSAEENAPEAAESAASTLFLSEGWRAQLCGCSDCTAMYTKCGVDFLRDETDTVHHYESQAKKRKGQFEQGMEALSQMDRIKQVEAISMYADMKTDLMDYLAEFAREGKVVKEEDIREFFQKKKTAKRRKIDLPPPSSCK